MQINLIGALTIKSYSFKGRSWELSYINSIDFFDCIGSNLKIELRGKQILRILPRQNDHLNENWITDKSRFAFDYINNQRLTYSYKKHSITNTLGPISWVQSIYHVNIEFLLSFLLKKHGKWSINIVGLMDSYMSAEMILFFKDFLNFWGSSNLITSVNFNKYPDITYRSSFIFVNGIKNLLTTDACIFVNFNPRIENPIINLKIRRNYLKNKIKIFSFGFLNNPIYTFINLGSSTKNILNFLEGKQKSISKILKFKNIEFLIGNSLVYRKDSVVFLNLLNKLKTYLKFNLSFVYNKLSYLAAFELGFVPGVNHNNFFKDFGLAYNIIFNLNNKLNLDSFLMQNNSFSNFAFSPTYIYYGSFGDSSLNKYSYLLPLSVLLETNGNYLNINGMHLKFPGILPSYKESKDFYFFYNFSNRVLKSLNFFVKRKLIFNSFNLYKNNFFFNKINRIESFCLNLNFFSKLNSYLVPLILSGVIYKNVLNVYQESFYINDLYTSYSFFMLKMKKLHFKFSNRNF